MDKEQSPRLIDHFSNLEDPRIERNKLHKLIDILTIAICAVICNADTWEDIEEFAISKEGWFRKFLELPNGIPPHDKHLQGITTLALLCSQSYNWTWNYL